MDDKETDTLGLPGLLKEEVHSPPLSPRSSYDDDDETDPDDSAGEEEEGRAPVGTGGAVVAGGPRLKKGPWTPDEDLRLRTYVEANGEGNWNQVQRNAGLNRCGKSCRLRWANHLRPNLKKGPFSKEEEQTIIELHAKYGNKWAKMASLLPGRTDNEIKNFWNTRTKRLQKAGLDLYPDDLLSRLANQDMDCQSPEDSRGKKRPNELSNENSIEFDDIIFEKLDYKKQSENFLAPSFMIPQDSISTVGMNNSVKRHSSSGRLSNCTDGLMPEQVCYESEHMLYVISNDPSIVNGNFSTSGTIQRPMKMELPSLQYTSYESSNSWLGLLSSPTLVDQVDTGISSPASVLPKSECFASQNTPLLDAMVQQGHELGDPTKFHADYELLPAASYVYNFSPPYPVFDDNRLESNFAHDIKPYKFPTSSDVLFGDFSDSCGHEISAKPRFVNECSPHLEYQPNNESLSAILNGYYSNESTLSATDNDYQPGV